MTCVECLQGDSLHRPCADGCNAFPGGRFHTEQPEGPVPTGFVFLTLGNHIFLTQLYVETDYHFQALLFGCTPWCILG